MVRLASGVRVRLASQPGGLVVNGAATSVKMHGGVKPHRGDYVVEEALITWHPTAQIRFRIRSHIVRETICRVAEKNITYG